MDSVILSVIQFSSYPLLTTNKPIQSDLLLRNEDSRPFAGESAHRATTTHQNPITHLLLQQLLHQLHLRRVATASELLQIRREIGLPFIEPQNHLLIKKVHNCGIQKVEVHFLVGLNRIHRVDRLSRLNGFRRFHWLNKIRREGNHPIIFHRRSVQQKLVFLQIPHHVLMRRAAY